MRLSNRIIKGLEYRHPLFQADLPPLIEEQVPELLARLRAGDEQARSEAFSGHVRLAMQIVGRYLSVLRSDKWADDLVSAAMEGIGDALVKIVAGEMTHTNLTGYITSYVHRYISRALECRPIVRVPRITNFDRKAAGLEPLRMDRVGFSHPSIIGCVSKDLGQFDVEIREIIEKVVENDQERQILELRQAGKTDAEIADQLDLSKTTVFVIRKGIETRFLELFLGD